MKGKSITFRPTAQMRERLDALARGTDRPITYYVEKAIEAQLPLMEKYYEPEIVKLSRGVDPKARPSTSFPSHRPGEHSLVEDGPKARAAKKSQAG